MKISRINEALGYISDEICREAIEEISNTSQEKSGNTYAQAPRIASPQSSRRTPFFIIAASICAVAAAVPIFFSAMNNKNAVGTGAADFSSESGSQTSSSESTISESKSDIPSVYGETEIPVAADVYDATENGNSLEKMVFETHTIGDYTVKLVGKYVYKLDKEGCSNAVFANSLEVYTEKDGKLLETGDNANSASYKSTLINTYTGAHEFVVREDKIGSYLDVYDLEYPVISMRYYFDEVINPRVIKQLTDFAVIKDDTLFGCYALNAQAGTGAKYYSPEIYGGENYSFPYNSYAPNTKDEICKSALFAADKFRIADKSTLFDDEAGIKFTFDFDSLAKENRLNVRAERNVIKPNNAASDEEVDFLKKAEQLVNSVEQIEELKRLLLEIEGVTDVQIYNSDDDSQDTELQITEGKAEKGMVVKVFYNNGESWAEYTKQ